MAEPGAGRGREASPASLRLLAIALALLLAGLVLIGVPPVAIAGTAVLIAFIIWAGWRPLVAAGSPGSATPAQRAGAGPDLQAVLDALTSPTVLIDRRGIVIHANRAAYAAFPGFRPGYPISSAIRAPDILAVIDGVLAGEPEGRATLIDRVPVERSFELAVRRLSAEPGSHAVIHMAETTQTRRIEAMRVDFVANASHELRTPLASILGFVETLQGAAKDDAAARGHFLEIMAGQARRMARLIDDLLSLSKIEMSEHIRPVNDIDLALILPELIDALSGLAAERHVKVRLSAEPGTDQRVKGDRDELLRLFENLIENAIKYGASGEFVDIRVDRSEGLVRVAVTDYGPGIAEEHLPRLTERFYRADIHESRIQGGTGLGLAIVKHIVSRHRGKLSIESRPGKGATFTILLPTT